jgi:hypothetical protein
MLLYATADATQNRKRYEFHSLPLYLHLVPRLRMSGVAPLVPLCVFTAWTCELYLNLLPICTVAACVKAMYTYCGKVIVRDSNPHCHCIRPHCYQYVRWPHLSKGCASIAVPLLYAIRILTVTVSVHTVTNMYGGHSCRRGVPVLRYSYCTRFESSLSLYQATLLPICTVVTAVKAVCQYCGTVTVRDSNPHCHCIRPHCYQYFGLKFAFICNTKSLSAKLKISCCCSEAPFNTQYKCLSYPV